MKLGWSAKADDAWMIHTNKYGRCARVIGNDEPRYYFLRCALNEETGTCLARVREGCQCEKTPLYIYQHYIDRIKGEYYGTG